MRRTSGVTLVAHDVSILRQLERQCSVSPCWGRGGLPFPAK